MHRAVKSLSHPTRTVPAPVRQGVTSCLSQPHAEMPEDGDIGCSVVQGTWGLDLEQDLKPSSGPVHGTALGRQTRLHLISSF